MLPPALPLNDAGYGASPCLSPCPQSFRPKFALRRVVPMALRFMLWKATSRFVACQDRTPPRAHDAILSGRPMFTFLALTDVTTT
ncbi:hypothetical protein CDEST_07701 [Colletotrichum destructivum]|uniref:Uncharacterized protein n=1 Tax=Colletotrichum destructivum TaxID=34406 RepID=A0AAX4IHA7_9PEZI|nr:hypothetical protein CDEST_07701 [Colletotrichum destructivum]